LRVVQGHNVVIASSRSLDALGLSAIVARVFRCNSVRSVADFSSLQCALMDPTDLVILDLDLPGLLSPHGVRRLRNDFPHLKLAVMSAQFCVGSALSVLGAGAHAFVPKTLSPDELLAAFRCVQKGQIFVPKQMSESTSQLNENGSHEPQLTERQREVLRLISDGKSNKEIARALCIAEATVKVHASAAYRAIGVNSRARATAVFRHFEEPQGVLKLVG
jgi:DNA-binding NarL/FixJ family response regulator